VLDAQIVIFEVDVEIRVDQLVLDELPDISSPSSSTTGLATLIFAMKSTSFSDGSAGFPGFATGSAAPIAKRECVRKRC
jgi:hypothetical protein